MAEPNYRRDLLHFIDTRLDESDPGTLEKFIALRRQPAQAAEPVVRIPQAEDESLTFTERLLAFWESADMFSGESDTARAQTEAADKLLRALAATWKHHPDYDPSWRPDGRG